MAKFLLLIFLVIVLLPSPVPAEDIYIAAAASLREVVTEVAETFEQRHPGYRVLVNTASSGTLAKQIIAGAPADLFLSANPQWMDELIQHDMITPESLIPWASNTLVVVGRGAPLGSLNDLKSWRRLAIGNTESVPAGRYARQLLEAAGLYAELQAGHRLVLSKDVRQALLYAEQGVVDGAIIYASDARLLQRTKIRLVPNAALQPMIDYPIALTRKGEEKSAAVELFKVLISSETGHLLERYGLVPSFHAGG